MSGQRFPVRHCRYGVSQATHQWDGVSTRVRYEPVHLTLDVAEGELLLAWAAAAHQQHAASVVFADADGGSAVETLVLAGAYCVSYEEQFVSGDTNEGAYVCHLVLSDPAGFTMQAGGPATAFVAPAAGEHGVPGAIAAVAANRLGTMAIGGVAGATPLPDAHTAAWEAAVWEAAAKPREAIDQGVAREWLLENAALLTAAATVTVAPTGHRRGQYGPDRNAWCPSTQTSDAMLLADDTILTASSQRRLPDDEMPANLHQDVIDVLGTVAEKDRGDGHGKCAEPQIISQAIRAGKSLKGAKSLAMEVQAKGEKNIRHPSALVTHAVFFWRTTRLLMLSSRLRKLFFN